MDQKGPTCQEHQKRLKLWCVNCKTGVCVLCVVNHNKEEHKLVHPEDVVSEQGNDIDKFLNQISDLQSVLSNSKQKLDDMQEEITQNKEQSIEDMVSQIDQIIQILTTLKQDLTDQYTQNYYDVTIQQIENLQNAIKKQNQNLEEIKEETEDCIKDKTPVMKVDHFINNNKKDIIQNQIDQNATKTLYLQNQLDRFKTSQPTFTIISQDTNFGKMINPQISSSEILQEILEGMDSENAPAPAKRLVPSKISWDTNKKSKHIEILNNGQLAQKQKSYFGWASSLIDYCIDRGQVMITFKVEQAGKEGFADLYIGLCANDKNIKFDNDCLNGYGKTAVWSLNRNGDFYEPKRGCVSKGKEERKFDTMDEVSVAVNMFKKEASFQLNGEEKFVISNLQTQVIPYICLGGTNQSVSIQNFYIS